MPPAIGQEPGWWPSWELFGDSLVLAVLLGAVLPLVGGLLVLRQQLFVAASIGQSANLGIALALQCGLGVPHALSAGEGDVAVRAAGLLAAIVTTVVCLRALSTRSTTLEARNAWMFLFGGSASMVLLAQAPHGMQELQRLLLSSLLFASPFDGALVGACLAVGLLVLRWQPRRLLLWAMDPRSAAAYGTSVLACDLLVGAYAGFVIGYAVYATGLLFTFGMTVLPVLCAREVAGSLRAGARLALLFGSTAPVAGLLCAHRFDLPPGQATVALLGALALLLRLLSAWRCHRRA